MQPYPQAPQGGYPQFQDGHAPQQPGPQPGFNVVHNNPYGQPQQPQYQPGPQYPQPQTAYPGMPGAVYVPPPQYGMPMQGAPMADHDKERLIRIEVDMIDRHLSTGCYCVYNAWLYIVAVISIIALCNYGSRMISVPSNAVSFIEGILTFAYSFSMINALKKKKLEQVELGFKLAIGVAIITPITLYINFSNYGYLTSTEIAQRTVSAYIPYAIFHFLAMIYPILKIRKHIKAREEVVKRSSISFDI